MSTENPVWLQSTREFCRSAGIEISGWGSDTLIVNAESPDRAKLVASQLRPLGFEPIQSEDDAKAGLLLLSRDPAATLAKQIESWASVDVSRRPAIQRVASVVEAAFSVWCFWYSLTTSKPWVFIALGLLLLWDACRVLGWRLEITPEALRFRRYFLWTALPWTQVQAVETAQTWGRGQQAVRLTLTGESTLILGAFGHKFARILRDRLRNELDQRQRSPK
jgi:membrane protein YdbS with pleckstrin-like domain